MVLLMRKEKEMTIKNQRFKVTQLGFADGMELLTTLGKLLGPAVSSGKGSSNPMALMGDVVARLNYNELASLTDKLAKTTRIEREPGKWPNLEPEVDLAGQYDLTLRWLGFALEVNY
jgi:hypothetical protein